MNMKTLVVLGAVLLGCNGAAPAKKDPVTEPEPEPDPSYTVEIAGSHSVVVGLQIALSATTEGGTDADYAWTSADPSVATVDPSGVVTGVALGDTEITATGDDTGAMATHTLVVTTSPSNAWVVLEGLSVVQVGDSNPFSATTHNADDASYTWTSSAPHIATVDSSGRVSGQAAGVVTLAAMGNTTGLSGVLEVTVIDPVSQYDDWRSSGHADATSQAFTHWNTERPAEVPESCAGCHGTPGFLDRIGADGSTADVVDQAHPVGATIACATCHDAASESLTHVVFPSGDTLTDLGREATCMTCHQGGTSGDAVQAAISAAGVGDDTPSTSLGFAGLHDRAAGAIVNATRVGGGYQAAGQVYEPRLRHVPGYDTCTGCHDPHTLQVRLTECQTCHTGVTTLVDLRDIRMIASADRDYDGDGDVSEGVYDEVDGLKTKLLTAIRTYASEQSLGAICFAPTDPFWFNDTDQSGDCSSSEATPSNAYANWTPRLLRTAYTLGVVANDPGSWVHNGRYTIQLLHDAIDDLNVALTTTVDLSAAVRGDVGHFDATGNAARNWGAHLTATAECAVCHGGSEGLDDYLANGVGSTVPERDAGLDCATCHADPGVSTALVSIDAVRFPSGITLTDAGNASNVCMTCHQGRTSKKQVDDAVGAGRFEVPAVHGLAAAGVKKGTLAQVGYEYSGKQYSGDWVAHGYCIDCHAPGSDHSFSTQDNTSCTAGCHAPTPIGSIRASHTLDYDGDGSSTEPLADELAALASALMTQLNLTTAACHADVYPHFFVDGNGSGPVCDPSEVMWSNRFTGWSPATMKAAHNYRLWASDPGAWVHNFDYMAQLLIDSTEDQGGSVSGFIRPTP